MFNEETITRLTAVIADEAREAFAQLLAKAGRESPYGFAIYTDDSATGVDAAINTQEAYCRKTAEPRSDKFAAYWHTTEWAFEGGVTDAFGRTSELIAELTPDTDDESTYDRFRESVFGAMIRGMDILVKADHFAPYTTVENTLFLIAVTDSEDDDRIMESSIQTLNPAHVYEALLRQQG